MSEWNVFMCFHVRKRFQGELAENAQRYAKCILEIGSVQAALLVQGLARGIGPKSEGRNEAIFAFSVSLLVAWIFEAAVFDAGEVDPQRAARLRLSFRESAALAASMLYVLTGLAGYVMAEQGDPDASAAGLLQIVSLVSMFVAVVLVGRIVKDAKNKERTRAATAAGDLQMVANPAGAQMPGVAQRPPADDTYIV